MQRRFKNLNKRNRIKHFLGWAMLVVFTIGITPKIYLHDAFTHHKDERFSGAGKQQQSIGTFEYSCGFINIESTVPFLEAAPFIDVVLPAVTNSYPVQRTVNALYRFTTPVFLRGPPAII